MRSLFLTEKIGHPDKGDTNMLIAESVERGLETYAFRANELFLEDNLLKANAHKVFLENGELKEEEKPETIIISEKTIVTIRLNPPFDSRYFSTMMLLHHYRNSAQIYNNPLAIVNYPEKILATNLLKFTPKTLVSENLEKIENFWRENNDIIIKPLYEFAGRSVFRLKKEEENYKSIFQLLSEKYSEPLIAQQYIPEVKKGDKRIVLLDGEYIGCFNRVPPDGQIQAAIARGGSFQKSELTPVEKDICGILKPLLKKEEILICGLDTIGDYLTEVNVTCPAGMVGLKKLYNINFAKLYWNFILK
ncbi:MAG TPA: hypothetical protein DIV86_05555 [Alphaproteobacteria bacterium]|nr:hypothetical protein [Alphaproteobacteria bacterium]